jgi:hypothetical protein
MCDKSVDNATSTDGEPSNTDASKALPELSMDKYAVTNTHHFRKQSAVEEESFKQHATINDEESEEKITQIRKSLKKSCVADELLLSNNDFPSDKGIFDNLPYHYFAEQLPSLVKIGACQPRASQMPNSVFPAVVDNSISKRKVIRKFSDHYYNIRNSLGETRPRNWIAYSLTKHYVYCHYCWLFGNVNAKQSAWVTGYTNWQHLWQAINKHANCHNHLQATAAYCSYVSQHSVDAMLEKQISEGARRWKEVLTVQFGLIRIMASLGIAFRGSSGNIGDYSCGNYLTLIKFIATRDPILRDHLASEEKIKYLSKTITNEQISILASQTREKILNDCKKAKFYTIIADSSTDITHTDQLAILLRFVCVDYDNKTTEIREHFLEYAQITDASAKGIVRLLCSTLFEKCKLEKQYLRGQSYDGASVMGGSEGGVQALLLRELGKDAFAPYVHCPPHQLNLILMHAAEKVAPIATLNLFSYTQAVYTFFAESNRRWDLLLQKCSAVSKIGYMAMRDTQLQTNETNEKDTYESFSCSNETEGISHCRTILLKSMCTTRWSARHKSTEALLRNFGAVIDSLCSLICNKHDSNEVRKAFELQQQLDWPFFLTLSWWNVILSIADTGSKLLQAKSNDLFTVLSIFKNIYEQISQLRSDIRFEEICQKAKEDWCNLHGLHAQDAQFKEVRIRRTKRMADEIICDERLQDARSRYKVEVFFYAIDTICTEVQQRQKGIEKTAHYFGFLEPAILQKISAFQLKEKCDFLVNSFSHDLSASLGSEMENFRSHYFSKKTDNVDEPDKIDSVFNYLNFLVTNQICDVYPNVEILLRLFLTLPTSIASAERSFSVLRRIKTYMRSSLANYALNDFAILCIERAVAEKLDMTHVIDMFSNAKSRRGLVI